METWPDLRKSAEIIGQFMVESEQPCGFPAGSSYRLLIRRSDGVDQAQVNEHIRGLVAVIYRISDRYQLTLNDEPASKPRQNTDS